MAYASVTPLSSRTAAVQRPTSLIPRPVDRNAVRTRLACGCMSHNHTCHKHAGTTAHAVRQGSVAVATMSTPSPPTMRTRSCRARGINGQGLFSTVKSARRAPCVSFVSPLVSSCQSSAETMYDNRVGRRVRANASNTANMILLHHCSQFHRCTVLCLQVFPCLQLSLPAIIQWKQLHCHSLHTGHSC